MPKKNLSIKKKEIKVKETLKKFINYTKSKGRSKRTVQYYQNRCKRLIEYLQDLEIENIDEIEEETILEFRLYLKEHIENNTSVNTVLRAVRAFLYYCMKLGYIDKFKIEMVSETDRIKETYTDCELKILLQKPNINECGFSEYRTWVMINWFLSTGNRMRTVRNIKIKDLDFDGGFVKLRKTKNYREQVIPLTKAIIKVLNEYLRYRDGESEDYLFCNIYGQKLTTNAVGHAVRRYNLSRGVNKTSSHLFRHTFAKLWIKNGGDIFRLQRILGHSSIEMVRSYVNMFGEDLKEDFEKFNPINQYKQTKRDRINLKS